MVRQTSVLITTTHWLNIYHFYTTLLLMEKSIEILMSGLNQIISNALHPNDKWLQFSKWYVTRGEGVIT